MYVCMSTERHQHAVGRYVLWMRRGNAFSRVCVCLSVCPVPALTFECLDLETSFLVRRYLFRTSCSCSYVKVIGSRSRSHEQRNGVCVFCSDCDFWMPWPTKVKVEYRSRDHGQGHENTQVNAHVRRWSERHSCFAANSHRRFNSVAIRLIVYSHHLQTRDRRIVEH